MNMDRHFLNEIAAGSRNALVKKRIINYYIYNGSSTLTDLSKELNLSVPTVTKFVSEMCEEGFINDYGKLETNGGRHPNIYGLNPESGYFIGIETQPDGLDIGLVNFKGDMVEIQKDIPYTFENTPESLDELCQAIKGFIDHLEMDKSKIFSIYLNISGRVNPDKGYSYSIFNFDERPLTDILTEKIGYNVAIDNDTRAMTYGEYLQGCVKGEKDVLFVNASMGLGLGIIIDGKLYKGKAGFSGEFGHISTFDNEIICHCGKKGCLETEASGKAFLRILSERISNGESSILSAHTIDKKKPITLKEALTAVDKEDMLCIEIIDEIGQKLGKHIAGLINLFNPELVIIGGSLSLAGDYLLEPLKSAIRKYSLNLVNKDSVISVSKLKSKAGVIGACLLARGKMFKA